jgi:hypothetical protein
MKWPYLMAEADGGGGGDAGNAAPEGGVAPAVTGGGGAGGDGESARAAPRDDGRDERGRYARKDGGEGAGDPKAAKPPEPKKYKVPYKYRGQDGKDVEGEDEVDENRLIRSYQVERGLRLKMEDHAKERESWAAKEREYQERLTAATQDARAFLPEDADPVEYHAQQLERLLQARTLDPKDRQIAKLTQALQERDQREQERSQQEQEAAQRRDAARVVDHIASKVIPLVEKAGLPKNDLALERATKFYFSALRQGIDDPDPEIIAEEVVGEFAGTLESMSEKMDGARVLKLFPRLGAKIAGALRDQYKQRQAATQQPAPKKDAEQRQQERGAKPAEAPARPRLLSDKAMDEHLGIPR